VNGQKLLECCDLIETAVFKKKLVISGRRHVSKNFGMGMCKVEVKEPLGIFFFSLSSLQVLGRTKGRRQGEI
jgi:hypothetical protein